MNLRFTQAEDSIGKLMQAGQAKVEETVAKADALYQNAVDVDKRSPRTSTARMEREKQSKIYSPDAKNCRPKCSRNEQLRNMVQVTEEELTSAQRDQRAKQEQLVSDLNTEFARIGGGQQR